MIRKLYLLFPMTYNDALDIFDCSMSITTVFGIDIVIEQDEHCKFGGSLLKITQRSYYQSTNDIAGDFKDISENGEGFVKSIDADIVKGAWFHP
jgi:hypothetical protein